MSRQNSATDDDAGAIDLTPMLDVVFIMLIFFIVTATFIKEPGVEVERPDATTSDYKNSKILIAVDNDDKIWIDKNEIDESLVKDQIELLIAENPKSPVVIQADSKSTIKMLNIVAQKAREVGVADISIATNKQ
ncbi:ExbD/TolR family protein [Marinagarivorans algicola]|uniref:ExbD/TolR family protein n=1 Tax=Marinagarivorans algicola TaxID=1513270 RepID=UPI0006B5529C|nr:biopolymer transporter ExbD [Marinagarivorans algicola]